MLCLSSSQAYLGKMVFDTLVHILDLESVLPFAKHCFQG